MYAFSSSSYCRMTQRTLWKACVNCIYKARSRADHGFDFCSGSTAMPSRSHNECSLRWISYEIVLYNDLFLFVFSTCMFLSLVTFLDPSWIRPRRRRFWYDKKMDTSSTLRSLDLCGRFVRTFKFTPRTLTRWSDDLLFSNEPVARSFCYLLVRTPAIPRRIVARWNDDDLISTKQEPLESLLDVNLYVHLWFHPRPLPLRILIRRTTTTLVLWK